MASNEQAQHSLEEVTKSEDSERLKQSAVASHEHQPNVKVTKGEDSERLTQSAVASHGSHPNMKDNECDQINRTEDYKRKNFNMGKKVLDFRKTAKYSNRESYVSQRHHSIGTGLYCTDDIEDLPPRYREKVFNILESILRNTDRLPPIPNTLRDTKSGTFIRNDDEIYNTLINLSVPNSFQPSTKQMFNEQHNGNKHISHQEHSEPAICSNALSFPKSDLSQIAGSSNSPTKCYSKAVPAKKFPALHNQASSEVYPQTYVCQGFSFSGHARQGKSIADNFENRRNMKKKQKHSRNFRSNTQAKQEKYFQTEDSNKYARVYDNSGTDFAFDKQMSVYSGQNSEIHLRNEAAVTHPHNVMDNFHHVVFYGEIMKKYQSTNQPEKLHDHEKHFYGQNTLTSLSKTVTNSSMRNQCVSTNDNKNFGHVKSKGNNNLETDKSTKNETVPYPNSNSARKFQQHHHNHKGFSNIKDSASSIINLEQNNSSAVKADYSHSKNSNGSRLISENVKTGVSKDVEKLLGQNSHSTSVTEKSAVSSEITQSSKIPSSPNIKVQQNIESSKIAPICKNTQYKSKFTPTTSCHQNRKVKSEEIKEHNICNSYERSQNMSVSNKTQTFKGKDNSSNRMGDINIENNCSKAEEKLTGNSFNSTKFDSKFSLVVPCKKGGADKFKKSTKLKDNLNDAKSSDWTKMKYENFDDSKQNRLLGGGTGLNLKKKMRDPDLYCVPEAQKSVDLCESNPGTSELNVAQNENQECGNTCKDLPNMLISSSKPFRTEEHDNSNHAKNASSYKCPETGVERKTARQRYVEEKNSYQRRKEFPNETFQHKENNFQSSSKLKRNITNRQINSNLDDAASSMTITSISSSDSTKNQNSYKCNRSTNYKNTPKENNFNSIRAQEKPYNVNKIQDLNKTGKSFHYRSNENDILNNDSSIVAVSPVKSVQSRKRGNSIHHHKDHSSNLYNNVKKSAEQVPYKNAPKENKRNQSCGITGDQELISEHKPKYCVKDGFFIRINVSESASDVEHWQHFFRNVLNYTRLDIDHCCKFSDYLILEFEDKVQAQKAQKVLLQLKLKSKHLKVPRLIKVSQLSLHIKKPCDCEERAIEDCRKFIENCVNQFIGEHEKKIEEVDVELKDVKYSKLFSYSEMKATLMEKLDILRGIRTTFVNYKDKVLEKVENLDSMLGLQKLKAEFTQECNSLKRCLPIYSKKSYILDLLRFSAVSIVVAETGSGKSTQIVEYALQSPTFERGTIVCTQPRKIAAISLAQFVSGQLGYAVGKLIGYDVGTEKKLSEQTRVIFMTDYCLLKKCIRNRKLTGISCVVIDEAHERSLHTDLLLGLLKQCIDIRHDLRIMITSATIDPSIFVDFFGLSENKILKVPGRAYPVKVIWLDEDVSVGWNYIEACVKRAYDILIKTNKGDILVFLTSPSETEEAVVMFKDLCSHSDKMPLLICLHGRSDVQEQMLVFQTTDNRRKIIFATNAAETSLTIPGVEFVIDSGMAKEMSFDGVKNKNCLKVTFINKSSAEQRKGRAGRTRPGTCYRLYSENNFKNCMPDRPVPEILKTNLEQALLKIFEFGLEPDCFDFIESPPKEAILKSIDSLDCLGAIENNKLTSLGAKIAQLPVEPRLGKFILRGIDLNIGYETVIITALMSEAGKLFLRNDESKIEADEKKRYFCQKEGDLCTYLELYKRWLEVYGNERFNWCVNNFINFKALNIAAKIIAEITFSLRMELSISLKRRYNNDAFKSHFESILFECFSENLCVYSGHPKLGYVSPYLSESSFLHPSSALCYLSKNMPEFVIYGSLMETSRTFLIDVTLINEDTIKKAFQAGTFKLELDMLKRLQIPPKVLGPFGESVLIRYILGKGGSKIMDLESTIEKFTNTRNFKVDVFVEKGIIVIYIDRRFHDKMSLYINEIIKEAHVEMAREEDVIKMVGSSSYFCLGTGGVISDIVMPGEFREVIVENLKKEDTEKMVTSLKKYGTLQSVRKSVMHGCAKISATYLKVKDAETALQDLKKEKTISVCPKPYFNKFDKNLPLYRLKVNWCRRPCSGTGWIEFQSQEDCILASGILTMSSFCIGDNYILFTPANHNVKELYMKNLPEIVDEIIIRKKTSELLPDNLKIKKVTILHKTPRKTTESEFASLKQKLLQLFIPYTHPSKIIIDLKHPCSEDFNWEAFIYFECSEDGERAFRELQGNAKLDSYVIEMKKILKSHLSCTFDIYHAVKTDMDVVVTEYRNKKMCDFFSAIPNYETKSMVIRFSCLNVRDLNNLRQKLMKLLQGHSINCFANSKYFFLFSKSGRNMIKSFQSSTNTFIKLNDTRKLISIYGSQASCRNAELEIHSLVTHSEPSTVKVFDLNSSLIPPGFLKSLYSKFSFDLFGLIDKFELKCANLDATARTLRLEGSSETVRKAEEELEKICSELYNSSNKIQQSEENEICHICFEAVSYDFKRLESCGHVFCKQCLLLQIESKVIPLICAKQGCDKPIFLDDIKQIISLGDSHLKKSFCNAALQYHVSCNNGKINYCPTPDCPMVCRKSKRNCEFLCPGCDNVICTFCQSAYHYGMTCDMFQNCQKDEDYSLKAWMEENETDRKLCPNCRVPIEKASGCNHIECINCKAHLCWLCLEVFPTGNDVYQHLPYCSMNE